MVAPGSSVITELTDAVERLQGADLDRFGDRELLGLMRDLEVVRRRLDAGTDRLVARCDATRAYREDGHKSTKPCVKHLGRLSGPEAHGRTQTARVLQQLPLVAARYAAGEIPTEVVRAIARVAANPRVGALLDVADAVFAEQAATEGHDAMVTWLRQWEDLADADGAARASARSHLRRDAQLHHDVFDDAWHLRADVGDLQGATIADIFAAHVQAELEADIAEARAAYGDDWTHVRLARTPAQRRADALFAIFCRAMAQPADARNPEPLVDIVIDRDTLEAEIRRAAGQPVEASPDRVDDRICHTVSGTRLHPSDALAALVVGHVRRVVVDSASNVIDVGRKRRLFTGASRDAVFLQTLIRDRGGTGCRWPGCEAVFRRLQVDHRRPHRRGGTTDVANGDPCCGVHNRLEHHGFRPVHNPDGTWTILRPDNTPITPAA